MDNPANSHVRTRRRSRPTSPCPDRQRAFADTFLIEPKKTYLLHNRTPRRIRVVDRTYGELTLAPLAQRVVQGKRLAPFGCHLRELRQRHELRVREHTEMPPSTVLQLLIWGAVLVALGLVAFDVVAYGRLHRATAGVALVLAIAAVVAVFVRSVVREHRRRRGEVIADAEEGDIEFGVGGAYYDGNDTARRTKLVLGLLVVLVAGALLPALAIVVATDAKDLVVFDGGLRVKSGLESRMVSRLVQVVYTAVLALFPALMYFQFDRQRVGTIRGKWVRAIFHMDPQMQTLADVDARYGDELSEASGYSADSVRFLGGRNSPIVVATILISLGWILLVAQTESFDFAGTARIVAAADAADAAAERANDATTTAAADAAASEAAHASETAAAIAARSVGDTVPSTSTTAPAAGESDRSAIAEDAASASTSAAQAAAAEAAVRQPFFQLLVPHPSAATMAFLGAYFFAVYLVLRGYFRGDLRPKLYNQISARLVTVVVLAYLITVLFADTGEPNRVLWAMAFLAGVVPTTVLQRLSTLVKSGSSRLGDDFAEAFATRRPLTQIDGIDVYESSLLESEGVSDIAALTNRELVPMMINSRLPVEQLLDWTDQAVLIVLLGDGVDGEPDPRVDDLRRIGIRTASGLLALARSTDPATTATRQRAARILSGDGADDGGSLLQSLALQIAQHESILCIRQWHASVLADLDGGLPPIVVGDSDEVLYDEVVYVELGAAGDLDEGDGSGDDRSTDVGDTADAAPDPPGPDDPSGSVDDAVAPDRPGPDDFGGRGGSDEANSAGESEPIPASVQTNREQEAV